MSIYYNITDPLAQSFFIDVPCVITKVDLFFQSKDVSQPFITQIRKNEGGLPGTYIVPLTSVITYPSSVNISADASSATTVSFQNPIYLEPGEYSITLGSSSKNYKVWVSELGSTDVTTSVRITEQPYVGSLFKSQNASTWTPVQAEDLKFNLYRARFSANVSSTIDFFLSAEQNTNKVLDRDPLEVFPGSSTIRIYHPNHYMSDGSYVVIKSIQDNAASNSNVMYSNLFYGIPANAIERVNLVISNATTNTYTVDVGTASNATVATRFGGLSVVVQQDLKYDMIYPVVGAVNQSGSINRSFRGVSTDYTIDSSFSSLNEGDNELQTSKIITSNVNTTLNLSNANPFAYRLTLSSTNSLLSPLIDSKQVGVILATNIVDSPTYDNLNLTYDIVNIALNAVANVTQLSGNIGLIALANTQNIANAKSIIEGTRLTISGTNPNNGTYRVVEVLNDGANIKVYNLGGNVITHSNVSNTYNITNGTKFIYEEAATGGSVTSKYITRQIDFINPSTSINVRVDINKPDGSDIEIYYKTKLVGETEILANKEYTKIDGIIIPTSLSGEFYEVEKQIDSLEPFNALVLKIVFKTTNSAKVPKIKNLRAIVLE